MALSKEIAIIGVGQTKWGKYKDSTAFDHSEAAARMALEDAGLKWSDIQYLVAGSTIYSGNRGIYEGNCVAERLGWSGIPITNTYQACATGGYAFELARTRIAAGMCDVAMCLGTDSAPKGFFRPGKTNDPEDLDNIRFQMGVTNPHFFAWYAQRRIDMYGMTEEDMALVKVKNAKYGSLNPRARFQAVETVEDVLASPYVCTPLHLKTVCATSDGGAAVIIASLDWAKQHCPNAIIKVAAVSVKSPTYPDAPVISMPRISTDSAVNGVEKDVFRKRVVDAAYAEAGLGPEDLSLAEVYDLSTAYELDWYEDISLCPYGDAEKLLHDGVTEITGKTPVNISGGLSSFGEAAPAQALAQVCELTWQLRGQVGGERQVKDAKVGLACNYGLQGNSSCIILTK